MIRVFENSDLSARNSFKVHQQATKIVEFDSNSDLQQIFAEHVTDRWMVMGGANNILFTRDIDFPIIIPRNEQIEILSEGNEGVFVRVGAGFGMLTILYIAVISGGGTDEKSRISDHR